MSFISQNKQKLIDQPIKIPRHPLLSVSIRFGSGELLAFVFSIIAIFITSYLSDSVFWIIIIGPIAEKGAFYLIHIYFQIEIYKTTPQKARKRKKYYFKRAIKKGNIDLIEDIFGHDPIYLILMSLSVIFINFPEWILGTLSFFLAVFIVAILEVIAVEIKYNLYKKRLIKAGFQIEEYFETRFLISSEKNPIDILNQTANEFNLTKTEKKLIYDDQYFDSQLSEFNNRKSQVRVRKRSNLENDSSIKTYQIVITKAREISKKEKGQHRYFPIKKEKIYYIADNLHKDPTQINNIQIKSHILKAIEDTNSSFPVLFDRMIAQDDELLVSGDKVKGNNPFFVVEVKVFKDLKKLKTAMRYIMINFPVVQITHGKAEIINE
jgi:hypothetical protein